MEVAAIGKDAAVVVIAALPSNGVAPAATNIIDVGRVSAAWLAEQRGGKTTSGVHLVITTGRSVAGPTRGCRDVGPGCRVR